MAAVYRFIRRRPLYPAELRDHMLERPHFTGLSGLPGHHGRGEAFRVDWLAADTAAEAAAPDYLTIKGNQMQALD